MNKLVGLQGKVQEEELVRWNGSLLERKLPFNVYANVSPTISSLFFQRAFALSESRA
jgi:hypothetical protein